MKSHFARPALANVVALILTAGAFAISDECPAPPPPPPPSHPSCICEDARVVHRPPIREITPQASPRVGCGADLFVTADFIWWRPRQEDLAYMQSRLTGSITNPSRGTLHQPNFDWEPGFKVGLGITMGHDGWDLFAEYTWLRAHNSTTSVTQPEPVASLFPKWVIDPFVLFNNDFDFFFGSGDWDLYFNVIDLELGRNFFISQFLTLRPHIGLKGTWQDQDYRVVYRYNNEDEETFQQTMRQDVYYWGIGTRAGIDAAWHFVKSFSLFSNWSVTALWTDFDIDRKDTSRGVVTFTPAPLRTVLQTRNDAHLVKPILEFALGFRWETWWNDDSYHFSLEAGWEEQIWWSFNQLIKINEESAHGDLTLHGLTIKARFDF